MKIELIFTVLGALSAGLSGYYWVKSATAEVPAPPETEGVGALMGGYLISKNSRGERIDLHATLELQNRWNAKAAITAAVSAAFAILYAGTQVFPALR